jgi:hypothetical protein
VGSTRRWRCGLLLLTVLHNRERAAMRGQRGVAQLAVCLAALLLVSGANGYPHRRLTADDAADPADADPADQPLYSLVRSSRCFVPPLPDTCLAAFIYQARPFEQDYIGVCVRCASLHLCTGTLESSAVQVVTSWPNRVSCLQLRLRVIMATVPRLRRLTFCAACHHAQWAAHCRIVSATCHAIDRIISRGASHVYAISAIRVDRAVPLMGVNRLASCSWCARRHVRTLLNLLVHRCLLV